MRKVALTSAFVISLLLNANLSGQTKPAWISKEYVDPAGVPLQSIESFLNDVCQPSGLDEIQLIAVQNGHADAYHLHIYCRQDKAASAHYKVTLAPQDGNVFGTLQTLVGNPNVRIGPFYFGKERALDSFLVVERTS